MNGPTTTPGVDALSKTKLFEDYQAHLNAPIQGTEAVITNSLRKHYHEHHVTCTHILDILEYAAAGHATSKIMLEDEMYQLVRDYQRPSRRSDPGSLSDTVNFAGYAYSWEGNEFIVFEVQYERLLGSRVHVLFVLARRDQGEIVNGRHSLTEQLLFEAAQWGRQLHKQVYVFDESHWSKSKDLWKSVQDSSWQDVIMDPKTKQSLINDVEGFFDSKDLYREFAVPWKRGIILHGTPGNGKTMSIKALMCALSKRPDEIPALYVKSLRSCDGPQYSVNQIFRRARSVAPCLLILEDLDSLITDQVRSYFLNEVDGIESGDLGILIIGTTNHLSKLDPAIAQRPSRFDRKYHFALPEFDQRVAYCRFWKDKLATNKRVEFPEELCGTIATLTEGFTFAYMKELFVAALLSIARGGTGDEEEPGQASAKKGAEGRPSRVLPEVEVPLHLQSNLLLKVFTQQTKILLEEMDNRAHKESSMGPVDDEEPSFRITRHVMARPVDTPSPSSDE